MLVLGRQNQARRPLRRQLFRRRRVERYRKCVSSPGMRKLDRAPENGLMTDVNAVEIPQCDHRKRMRRERVEIANYLHRTSHSHGSNKNATHIPTAPALPWNWQCGRDWRRAPNSTPTFASL